MADTDVELKRVFKAFRSEVAVRNLNMSVKQGEFFSILGPSGCGKTTTLRLIAGFETPTSGEILVQGKNMVRVPPFRRPINTVFPELCSLRPYDRQKTILPLASKLSKWLGPKSVNGLRRL